MKMNRNDKTHKLTPVEEAIRYFDPYPHPVLRMMAEDYESRQKKNNKFDGEGDGNIEKTLEPYSYDLDDTYAVEGYYNPKTGEINHYNIYGEVESGPIAKPKNLRHYISTGIMQAIEHVHDTSIIPEHLFEATRPYSLVGYCYPNPDTETWFDEENGLYKRGLHGGTAQNSYLTGPVMQRELFHKAGYIDGVKGDYGKWRSDVEKAWKRSFLITRLLDRLEYALGAITKRRTFEDDIPIYQTAPDAIDRDILVPIYEFSDHRDYGPDYSADLIDPAYFTSQVFLDPYTGDLYRQDWDLNDYGGHKPTWYETLFSNFIDFIGRPTFVTTGVQPIHDNGYEAFYDWICGYPMMDIEKEESHKVNSIKGLDIRKDKDAYKFVRPNVLSDLAKPSVRKSLGVTDIVNPLWEIIVTPEYTHDDFNDKYKK